MPRARDVELTTRPIEAPEGEAVARMASLLETLLRIRHEVETGIRPRRSQIPIDDDRPTGAN